jgi:2-amino-4-hydroxy-6-hydroxymethyldihydropteridine diphosphokinase
MNQVVIGLGSNIDPERNLAAALRRIALAHRELARSRLVETEPIGIREQPKFQNGAVLIETDFDRPALADWLRDLETELGRTRDGHKYGPRTIDLDILVFNGKVVHRDFHEREFVRDCVLEVLPGLNADSGGAAV